MSTIYAAASSARSAWVVSSTGDTGTRRSQYEYFCCNNRIVRGRRQIRSERPLRGPTSSMQGRRALHHASSSRRKSATPFATGVEESLRAAEARSPPRRQRAISGASPAIEAQPGQARSDVPEGSCVRGCASKDEQARLTPGKANRQPPARRQPRRRWLTFKEPLEAALELTGRSAWHLHASDPARAADAERDLLRAHRGRRRRRTCGHQVDACLPTP